MPPSPSDPSPLRQEADRLKSLEALGRSSVIKRLFDFLVERAEEGAPPKEIEIAAAVFNRGPSFDAAADASVRVYAHRLRNRLDASYRIDPSPTGVRLSLPRGEYRIVLVDPNIELASPAAPNVPAPLHPLSEGSRRTFLVGLGLAFAAGGSLTAAALELLGGQRAGQLQQAADKPFWLATLKDNRPLVVVLGDYYMMGESADGMDVDRLVREYSINSKDDLDSYLMKHPEQMGRLVDLDLRYLPIGAGAALARVASLIAVTGRERTSRVILRSDLTPAMLSTSDVIYVGYFSGMDWFLGYALAGSRFRMGDNFDEITDRLSKRRFRSEGGPSDPADRPYHDFAYISNFQHPAGGRVTVLAGTRDAGLLHAGFTATTPQGIDDITRAANERCNLEALFEVTAFHRTSVGGRLVAASSLVHPNGEPPHPSAFS